MPQTTARTAFRPIFAEALESRTLFNVTIAPANPPAGGALVGQFTSTGKLQKFSAALSNGTEMTIEFKFGSMVISQLNNQVYLTATGTTARSTLALKGAISIGNAFVGGPLKSFQAPDTDVSGEMTINGSVGKLQVGAVSGTMEIAGSLGVANIGDVTGTLATTGSMKKLTIGAVVSNALILSGANLGADGLFGGGDDTFAAGSIAVLNIDSPVVNSQIEAGVNPGADGVFGTADDFLSGGGTLGKVTLTGSADSTTRFEAGTFGVVKVPPLNTAKAPKKLANPLLDPNFVIPKA